MAEYFAGGHLRFVNGEWRDDNGNAIEIYRVRHGRWIEKQEKDTFAGYLYSYECSECGRVGQRKEPYCPNCGAKMDGGDDNSAMS